MSHNPTPTQPPGLAMSTDLPTLTILVPAYNSLPTLMRCLFSVTQSVNPYRTQLLVSDDCSPDYDLTAQPLMAGVTPLRTPHNMGFAGNVNFAAGYANGDYLCILNQDTRALPVASDPDVVKELLRPGWADEMLRVFIEHEDAGIVGPRLVFPSGHVQSVGGEFGADKGPLHIALGWGDPTDRRINTTRRVSWITGAAIMIRKADFVAAGGLDGETYKRGYFEDVDLCMKVRHQLKKEVYYCADATLVHEVGSTGGNPHFMENSVKFHQRWDSLIEVENKFVAAGY